jgi:hypothetical protein
LSEIVWPKEKQVAGGSNSTTKMIALSEIKVGIMGTSFWVRRVLFSFLVATLFIAAARLLRGHPLDYAIKEGLLWGAFSSLVYTLVLAYKLRGVRSPP